MGKGQSAVEGIKKAAAALGQASKKNIGAGYSDSAFPTFKKAAGTATAATGAVAYGAVQQAAGAVKNTSFLMIILGMILYFLRLYSLIPTAVTFIFSLVLFIISSYALSLKLEKKRIAIFIPMLVFAVWYFIFNGNYAPQFLIYFLSVTAAVSLLLALFTKGESVKPELFGFLPVIFLYLDIGALHYLTEVLHLSITPLLQSLLVYLPWWALFGLLTLPSEVSKNGSVNFLVNFTRIIGVLYLIFVLVAPAIPDLGYSQSLLPSARELEEAQARLRQQLPQGENPFISNLACSWNAIGQTEFDIQECIKKRKQESEITAVCKNRGFKESSSEFQDCFKKEEEIKKSALASGRVDPLLKEPTEAEFKVEQGRQITYQKESLIPIDLIIKNPRKLNLEVSVSCLLKKGSQNIPGEILKDSSFSVNEKEVAKTLICKPSQKLDQGVYTLAYEATLSNLKTVSFLNRLFVGIKTPSEKKELQQARFPGSQDHLSWSAREFARLNFELGQPSTNPLIDSDDQPVLILTLENLGPGELTQIKGYSLDLDQYGLTIDPECLQKNFRDFPLIATKKQSQLAICENVGLPPELANPAYPEPIEFTATLWYDYKIKKELKITIENILTK